MIPLLATLLVVPLIGEAIGRVVGPSSRYLLGTGVSGLVLFGGMMTGLDLIFVAACLVIGSALILVSARRQPRTINIYPLIPTIVAAVPAAVLFLSIAITPLNDYDGRAFWLLKAKAIAQERTVGGPFFQSQTSINPRNGYPVLVPAVAAVLFRLGGDLDDRHVRWLYLMFAIGFALEIRRRLTGWFSAETGAWCACLFLWLPQLATDGGGGAASAYNDIVLGAFVGCAFFDLVDRAAPARFGLWLALIVLTKNEGLALAAILLACGTIVYRRRVLAALPGLIIGLLILFAWKHRIARTDELDFANLLLTLPSHADRFAAALRGYAMQIVAFQHWGLLWPAVVLAVVVLIVKRDMPPVLITMVVVIPMVVLYAAVFAVSPWEQEILRDLAPRTLTHLLGPVIFILGRGAHRWFSAAPDLGAAAFDGLAISSDS